LRRPELSAVKESSPPGRRRKYRLNLHIQYLVQKRNGNS
jgi:hypothetical protein